MESGAAPSGKGEAQNAAPRRGGSPLEQPPPTSAPSVRTAFHCNWGTQRCRCRRNVWRLNCCTAGSTAPLNVACTESHCSRRTLSSNGCHQDTGTLRRCSSCAATTLSREASYGGSRPPPDRPCRGCMAHTTRRHPCRCRTPPRKLWTGGSVSVCQQPLENRLAELQPQEFESQPPYHIARGDAKHWARWNGVGKVGTRSDCWHPGAR